MSVKPSDIKEKIESYGDHDSYRISKNYLDKKFTKQANLIEPDEEDFKYPLKNKTYEFEFQGKIYCRSIRIESAGESLKGLELTVFDFQGGAHRYSVQSSDSINYEQPINRIIKSFQIKPPKKIISRIVLKEIHIDGYKEDDFEEIQKTVGLYASEKDSLNKILERIESEQTALENDKEKHDGIIESKKNEESALQTSIDKLTEGNASLQKTSESLKKTVDTLSAEEKSLTENKTTLTNNITQLEKRASDLNQEISGNQDELRKLVNSKNLFAYEVEEYIRQGNRDIRTYLFLSIIPWILIAYVTCLLFNGAADLTTLYQKSEVIDIWTIIFSRLPFVIVSGAIIIASYEISKIFVRRIIDIHRQKLAFSKLGIIARDVSEASLEGLEISDKEKFELRTKLKMDILKSHLKSDVEEDYRYEINSSLWRLYKDFLEKTPKNEKTE